jgi:hypothetical protein
MRLSIWQQFSSNHSASFTVVGVFPSPEEATKAAHALNEILSQIETWYDRDKRLALTVGDYLHEEWPEPTPPERAIGEQYGVEWRWAIDWTFGIWSKEGYDDQVSQVGNLVFLEPRISGTWQGPQPFDAIMGKLGGTVHVDADQCRMYPDHLQVASIHCTAPDEPTAEWIEMVFQDQLATGNTTYLREWMLSNEYDWLPDHAPILNQFSHKGRTVMLERIGAEGGLAESMAIMTEFLKSQGCTSIEYSFTQIDLGKAKSE